MEGGSGADTYGYEKGGKDVIMAFGTVPMIPIRLYSLE